MAEIKKFKAALRAYYKSKKQSCVIFERNFRSQHLQLQVHTCMQPLNKSYFPFISLNRYLSSPLPPRWCL